MTSAGPGQPVGSGPTDPGPAGPDPSDRTPWAGRAAALIRLGLALLGFMLALLAIAFDDHRLGWAGIALLAGSLIARLLQRRRGQV
jgi:hypothetical protein